MDASARNAAPEVDNPSPGRKSHTGISACNIRTQTGSGGGVRMKNHEISGKRTISARLSRPRGVRTRKQLGSNSMRSTGLQRRPIPREETVISYGGMANRRVWRHGNRLRTFLVDKSYPSVGEKDSHYTQAYKTRLSVKDDHISTHKREE